MNFKYSVLATLTYHDIFQYPLKEHELYKFYVGPKSSQMNIKAALENLSKAGRIENINGYLTLKGHNKLVNVRLQRNKQSQKKLEIAGKYTKLLKLIPSIKFIGITGALAMNNSEKKDDIDFLIISSVGTLWTTRFLANLLLLPSKRSPGTKKQKDKACLNMFIDEKDLKIRDKNLYTAHEIAQLRPVFVRDSTYNKFINANKWIYEYLPYWKPIEDERSMTNVKGKSKSALVFSPLALIIKPIEAAARWVQLNYMKSKITTETITDTQLFFHPENTKAKILKEYEGKLRKLGLT